MKALANEAKRLPDWPTVDHNWLRNPQPYDMTKLAAAVAFLRPKLAEAEALLERADQAVATSKEAAPDREPATVQ